MSLEAELQQARELSVAELADAIGSIGVECTRSGACCTAIETDDGDREEHTATVFPTRSADCGTPPRRPYDRRDLARPMGAAVAREGPVRTHECEGLGRAIDRQDAEEVAAAQKERGCGNWRRPSPSGRPTSPGPRPTASSSTTRRPDATGRHAARRSIAGSVASR